jgi:hypothetical protein
VPGKLLHLEDGEQAALVEWAKLTRIPKFPVLRVGDFLFAIPNGGKRGIREAARFKKLGVKPGVSDLFFAYPCGEFAGLWIEMKKQRLAFRSAGEAARAVSEDQEEFQKNMRWAGYETDVCYGCAEAINIISSYLEGDDRVRH